MSAARGLGGPGARLALAAAALLASGLSIFFYLGWAENRRELTELLEGFGVAERRDDLARQLLWERSPADARLTAARALTYDFLAARGEEEGSADPEERLEQPPIARDLALRVLRAEPSRWQGWLFLGATTYLERSWLRDRRLVTEAGAWERSLGRARELAPGKVEPQRLLAMAYLELWPTLSPAKKEAARELLENVFAREPRNYARLLPVWLEVAGEGEVFAPIPDRPEAWKTLLGVLARRGDWRLYVEARERFLEVLGSDVERRIAEAADQIESGERQEGRTRLLEAVAELPPELGQVPLLVRAMEVYPPGIHGLRDTRPLRAWLDWVLDLDAVGVRPLPPGIADRLASTLGELPLPRAAHAALVSGEARLAEDLEARAAGTTSALWAPYHLAKARLFLERGAPEAAAEALEQVESTAREGIGYGSLYERAARGLGDRRGVERAENKLARLARDAWPASAWRPRDGGWQLELLAERAADGLEIEFPRRGEGGAVVAWQWDGREIAAGSLRNRLRLSVEIEPGPHLLELRHLAGGKLGPPKVELTES